MRHRLADVGPGDPEEHDGDRLDYADSVAGEFHSVAGLEENLTRRRIFRHEPINETSVALVDPEYVFHTPSSVPSHDVASWNGQDARVALEELDSLIAGNVRATRARLRLRQEDLADEMGWTRAMVTSLESGTRRVTLTDAVSLCRALKVDLRELLQGARDETLEALGL